MIFLTENEAKKLLEKIKANPVEAIYGFNKEVKKDIEDNKLATIRQEKAPKS